MQCGGSIRTASKAWDLYRGHLEEQFCFFDWGVLIVWEKGLRTIGHRSRVLQSWQGWNRLLAQQACRGDPYGPRAARGSLRCQIDQDLDLYPYLYLGLYPYPNLDLYLCLSISSCECAVYIAIAVSISVSIYVQIHIRKIYI